LAVIPPPKVWAAIIPLPRVASNVTVYRAAFTVKEKAFVSLEAPRVIVAVRTTVASAPGLVTTPAAVITAGVSEAHVIVVPPAPVAGSVRFCLTLVALSGPAKTTESAALSAATFDV
jgi:hypothetical protein